VLTERLRKEIEGKGLISPNQTGFRKDGNCGQYLCTDVNVKRIKVLKKDPTVFELETLKGYTRPIEIEAELRLQIMEAGKTIRNILGVFKRTRQSFLRRCQSCIDVGGRNFEHLL